MLIWAKKTHIVNPGMTEESGTTMEHGGLEVPQPKKSEGFVRPLDRRKNVKDKYAPVTQLARVTDL